MPGSRIGIKFFWLGFFLKWLLLIWLIFIIDLRETGWSTDGTTHINIDKQHHQEKDAKSDAQVKDKTFAHVASGAYRFHIWEEIFLEEKIYK